VLNLAGLDFWRQFRTRLSSTLSSLKMIRLQLILATIVLTTSGCAETASPSPIPNGEPVQLHPEFPVVEGSFRMTKNWSVDLPSKFNRRIEDGSLVLWRPGFTIWTEVYGNDNDQTHDEQLAVLRNDSSPDAFDDITETDGKIIRYSYRLNETEDDNRSPAFYCFAISKTGYVMMAIYFDEADDIIEALKIWRSLAYAENAG